MDFSSRLNAREWMDDLSITDERLRAALTDLRRINRLLGGYRASLPHLDSLLQNRPHLDFLDLGTGTGDYLVHVLRRGRQFGTSVDAVGVDVNPVTVGHGRAWLDRELASSLRPYARIEVGDALELPYPDDAFDISHAALFLHHFHGPDAVRLLQEMNRVARIGIVINDLHRHPLAYAGIWALSRLFRMAPMVQHDGPLSVRRGFRRNELQTLAERANLPVPRIRWHWAFRWSLSTLPTDEA